MYQKAGCPQASTIKLKLHWDQFPRNFPVANVTGKSPACYEEVTRKLATFRPSRHVKIVWRVTNFLVTIVANLLRGSWRRRQQVCEEVMGKLVPVEFELNTISY